MVIAVCAPLLTANAAEEEHEHDHDFGKPVLAFHDVMAPLWHAEAGTDRQRDTCLAIPDMQKLSKAIQVDVTRLDAALQTMGDTCQGPQDAFDQAFSQLHDAFHQVSEANKAKRQ